MATNAFEIDFWIGRVFRSKDRRELGRHVIISDIKGSRAKCHNLINNGEERPTMWQRGSMISLKSLAQRWQTCPDQDCYCKGMKETQ